MLQSPEVTQRINFLRAESRHRELSNEELQEAITLMRQGRIGAAATSAKSKAAKAPVDSGALLDELNNL